MEPAAVGRGGRPGLRDDPAPVRAAAELLDRRRQRVVDVGGRRGGAERRPLHAAVPAPGARRRRLLGRAGAQRLPPHRRAAGGRASGRAAPG